MTAFMFAGQGIDLPWVDADVLGSAPVRELVDLASDLVRVDVMRLMTRGGRELARSEIVQPAMVAVCLGVHRLLEIQPRIVLGHSLGELAAWAAAGGISHTDAVRLAAVRGALMAREAAKHPGGLVRIKGDREAALRALAEASSLCIGAHNGPDEWVLAGDEQALAAVVARHPAVRLPVAGAWHSPAMAGAVDELAAAVAGVPVFEMRATLVANRDGAIARGNEIPELFVGQLVRPVQWAASLATLDRLEPRRLLAIGPGKMLRALVHRNLGVDRHVEMIDSLDAIARARDA